MGDLEGAIPIPGSKQVAHLRDNTGAAKLELAAEDLQFLDRECAPGSAEGARHSETSGKWIDRS